jgi:spore maturation protein B
MNIQTLSDNISNFLFLGMIAGVPAYCFLRGVKVYEVFVEGAKDGFQVVIKIIPYLVAILVAIGMFRASGGFDVLARWLSPFLNFIGMPTDVLPLALVRPFSGGAAKGVLADIIHNNGGNSYVSHLAATIMGSTETTFYVIAIYFGAVAIRRTRHAIAAGLLADATAVAVSLWICRILI